ncbi:VOC family protein [Chitinophaga nivalis]|uniref:VOC family protein n=1 Tax=Chitinophaga nivalis TaxID=2991709 RepID=A0ABT3IVJ7_9BACT|nr:VOC family protein [Chitinophaga nivalis]MCW3462314.1 VOC family protein [Chitinophaga nivalis]MCW3487995.1 VOC family protein [Chitinophaga nivalis]
MQQRISLITLGVRDLQRSLQFYEAGLGWKKSAESQENVAFFQLGGLVLSLYPWHLLAEDAQVPAEGSGFKGMTLAYNTESREETDAILQDALRAGATLVKPAQEVFWGGYSGYFSDPDGYLFEVAHNPFWKMNERGEILLPA